jgi:D-methionine transport system permease protein
MSSELLDLLSKGTIETLYMVFFATIIALIIGIPIGILLVITDKGGVLPLVHFNKVIGTFINVVRSLPEMILMIVLLPLARIIVGTTLGSNAAIVSLSIGAAPLIARIIENSLREVQYGKIEAAEALGSSPFEIVVKVLVPEALPSIVRGITMAIITVTSFTAIAGAIGGGGLGSLAVRYGYQRFRTDILIGTVIILIVIVQTVQFAGEFIAKLINKKRFNFE